MQAKIKDKEEIAKGTLLVTFDLLGQKVDSAPGQYTFVTLPKLIKPDDKGNKRHFSIVNSPNEKGIISIATRLRDTGFKNTLQQLAIGDKVEVGPIAGSFGLPDSTSQPLVFIAGGIGITPYISMLRYIKEEKLLYKIILIYSNRDKSSTAFYEELQEMSNAVANFKLIMTMTQDDNWNGEKRRVDAQFIKDHVKDLNQTKFWVVGPPQMNDAVVDSLKQLGISEVDINRENFTGY